MKRDWDVIREVLLVVESLDADARDSFTYNEADGPTGQQAILLWKSGYIEAIDVGTSEGPAIISPDLTWAGHDLLDTLRSKPVWDKVKSTASEKGIELTFDAVKMLAKLALDAILKG